MRAKYTPILFILLALAEMQGHAGWVVHLFGLAIPGARGAHFASFQKQGGPGQFRVFGMVATFGLIAVLAIVLPVLFVIRMMG